LDSRFRQVSKRTAFQRCADKWGFSLHAARRCAAEDRRSPEQLCRTITRPALANERVQRNAAGQVVLKLKTPWHAGMKCGPERRRTRCPIRVLGKLRTVA
jgi:hypothetical protein